ncbi:MAG: hypothetical protein KatS3mg102_2362 [Planctomycetota bacterium]|nr:MAG: hypothetical protein KatS3mg102_2362 [Planctomycetota bacterium]
MQGRSGHTPKFRVKIGGKELEAGVVRHISVDRAIDMADMFVVDVRNDGCKISDDPAVEPGNRVEIELGYEEGGGRTTRVMVGRVVALRGHFPRSGPMGLRIQGYATNHLLTQGRKTRGFKGPVTYSEIVQRVIAADYAGKLVADVEDSGIRHEYVFQRNQTDLEFFLELASRIGFELSVRFHADDPNAPPQLRFRRPEPAATPTRKLKKGENLLSFNPRTRTALTATGVTVQSWDPLEARPIRATADKNDVTADMDGAELGPQVSERITAAVEQVHEVPMRTEQELQAFARGRMVEEALEFVTAEAVATGNPDLLPGLVVELEGVGDIFSGQYYVHRVIHDLHDGGFNTRLGLRRTSIIKKQEPVQQPGQGAGQQQPGQAGQGAGPQQPTPPPEPPAQIPPPPVPPGGPGVALPPTVPGLPGKRGKLGGG